MFALLNPMTKVTVWVALRAVCPSDMSRTCLPIELPFLCKFAGAALVVHSPDLSIVCEARTAERHLDRDFNHGTLVMALYRLRNTRILFPSGMNEELQPNLVGIIRLFVYSVSEHSEGFVIAPRCRGWTQV